MTGAGGSDTPGDLPATPEPRLQGEAGTEKARPGYRQITFSIAGEADAALTGAADGSGDTRTDTINRAIQVYAGIQEACAEGGGSCIVTATGRGFRIVTADVHGRPADRGFLRQLLSRAGAGRS